MEYYKLLQLKREPFSNSPDPDYFFQSQQHHSCLQKLELALRLKRGLNVVMGDVGTGKTTLCREIIRKFEQEPEFETHLILDPSFSSTTEILSLLHAMICEDSPGSTLSEMALKEKIKQTLFQKGVDQGRTVVLIIDEGQKISSTCLEILRELLNYETNKFKLLQIIIFAQKEFSNVLADHANFADRINLLHQLKPLDFADTRNMIQHRLKLSSTTAKPRHLFTLPALWAIYRATNGYPRKIVHLCHQSVLAMIIQNRTRAGWALIRSCQHRMVQAKSNRWRVLGATGACIICLLAVGALLLNAANTNKPQITTQQSQRGNTAVQMPSQPQPSASATPVQSEIEALSNTQGPEKPPNSDTHTATTSYDHAPIEATPQTVAINKTIKPPVAPDAMKALPIKDDAFPPKPMNPPASLGQLRVKPGDTLLELIKLVYGTLSNRYVRSIIDANPQIENPNTINLNDKINFPALPFTINAECRDDHYIIMNQYTSLEKARDQLETLKRQIDIPLSLIAHWSEKDGLQFSVIAQSAFEDRQTANRWIGTLPDKMAAATRIQSGWPEGIMAYSSYFRRVHRQPPM